LPCSMFYRSYPSWFLHLFSLRRRSAWGRLIRFCSPGLTGKDSHANVQSRPTTIDLIKVKQERLRRIRPSFGMFW
jgi:hypothetical protein